MQTYLPYNPNSIIRVEETLTVTNGKIFLRHIPKKDSIEIAGFTETDSPNPAENQFSCDYALDSLYRDANRVVNFNPTHNGIQLTISYIAIGTVLTADDANEIKAHMENVSIHGGSRTDYKIQSSTIHLYPGEPITSDERPTVFPEEWVFHAVSYPHSATPDDFYEYELTIPSNVVIACIYPTPSEFGVRGRSFLFDKETIEESPLRDITVAYKELVGTTQTSDLQGLTIGDGLTVEGGLLKTLLGAGLHFDEQGRIAIFLGQGTVLSANPHGVRANSDGSFSILIDSATLHFNEANAITINIGEGMEVGNDGIKIKNGNGLAFDANGGLYVHCGLGIGYDEQNRIRVRNGDGLAFDSQGNLCTNGNGFKYDYNLVIPTPAQDGSTDQPFLDELNKGNYSAGVEWEHGKIYIASGANWSYHDQKIQTGDAFLCLKSGNFNDFYFLPSVTNYTRSKPVVLEDYAARGGLGATPCNGNLWYDSSTGKLKLTHNDRTYTFSPDPDNVNDRALLDYLHDQLDSEL